MTEQRTTIINIFNSYDNAIAEVEINQLHMWNLILFGARMYSMKPSVDLGNEALIFPHPQKKLPIYCAFENEKCMNSIHLFCDAPINVIFTKLHKIFENPLIFSNVIFNYIGHSHNSQNIVELAFQERDVNFEEIYNIFLTANANIFCYLYSCRGKKRYQVSGEYDDDDMFSSPRLVKDIVIKPDKMCMIYTSSWRGELTSVLGTGGSMIQTMTNLLKEEKYLFFKEGYMGFIQANSLIKIMYKVAIERLRELVNMTKWEYVIKNNPEYTEKYNEVCKTFPKIYINKYTESSFEYINNGGPEFNNLTCNMTGFNILDATRLSFMRTSSIAASTDYVREDADAFPGENEPANLDILISDAQIIEKPDKSLTRGIVDLLFNTTIRYTKNANDAYNKALADFHNAENDYGDMEVAVDMGKNSEGIVNVEADDVEENSKKRKKTGGYVKMIDYSNVKYI